MKEKCQKKIYSQAESIQFLGITRHQFKQFELANLIERLPNLSTPYYLAESLENIGKEQDGTKCFEQLVLAKLRLSAIISGETQITLDTRHIAKDLGFSTKHVEEAVSSLEEEGQIQVLKGEPSIITFNN
ncbi:MAG: hypothetical protein HRT89_13580 [Lentisphaeria bacterium]|nr:hypothetical protein [Lentisphaeria bacterium]NQZ69089.1 hypothetical protein [Lentisphaeria bacterium]